MAAQEQPAGRCPRKSASTIRSWKRARTAGLRLVVAMMAEKVLQQYEEVLSTAGYKAAMIDFHCLNVYNYYRPRLDPEEGFILLGIEKGALSLQYFQAGIAWPSTVSREVEPDAGENIPGTQSVPGQLPGEIPGFPRAAVYLHSDWEEPDVLLEAAAFGISSGK